MLEIRVLGKYDIRQDGESIEISSRPARTLLAYLLLTLGTRHPRERLGGLLWPDSSESNARKNLRQALWRLRKAIGADYLLSDNVSVAFDSQSDFWLDIAALEDVDERDLEEAVSTYGGELLPGFYADWVLLERERLAALYERKMHRLLEQLLQDQRWDEALRWGERWIAQGRTPEAAFRALMISHAGMGEFSKVQSAYERCVEALLQDIGVDPSPETQSLYENVMAGEAVPPLPTQRAGTRAATSVSTRLRLPAQVTPFIGRNRETAEVTKLLANVRLLTLTGPGGIGKTRLALEAAADAAEEFDHGVRFVNLATIASEDHLIQVIADALEFPLSSRDHPEEQLLRYLRGRQMLLVMDNFEHLLDGASLVNKILQAAPAAKVLVTSREKLELWGETTIDVAGMSYPDTEQSDDDLLAHDAIELFVQSARRALPEFEAAPGELKHVAEICRLVQGMPLAIELSAAWLDTLTLSEIVQELRRSLDILSTEMRDVPDRHRSIRAAFDHSWSLIGASEREVFMRLSVFRGGFTRDAAQHVAGASLEQLAALVGKSFLRHHPTRGRFEVHELMRQYAEEQLDSSPEASASAREAHASYFGSFMRERWDHVKDRRQTSAIVEIEADIENVRTAWRYRVGQRNAAELEQFVRSFRLIHELRGWNYAAAELFAEAVDAIHPEPAEEQHKALRAMLLAFHAKALALLGIAEQGIDQAREGVRTLRRFNRPEDLGLALDGLILCARYLNLRKDEERAAREFLELADASGDRWLQAFSREVIAPTLVAQGGYAEAMRLAESSLEISESSGDLIVSIHALSVMGGAAFGLGQYEESREYYLRTERLSQKIGYRWAVENSTKYLGHVALAKGEIEEAEIAFRESLRIANEIGLGRDVLNLLFEFARVRVQQGRTERAVELLTVVLEHPASHQTRWREGRIRDNAQNLLDELAERLPSHPYAAAVGRGKTLELDKVVAALTSARDRA